MNQLSANGEGAQLATDHRRNKRRQESRRLQSRREGEDRRLSERAAHLAEKVGWWLRWARQEYAVTDFHSDQTRSRQLVKLMHGLGRGLEEYERMGLATTTALEHAHWTRMVKCWKTCKAIIDQLDS
jgi:hypothetical protein